ncbi:MAG: hypothetical protein HOO88_05230 [Kiritimatiellaceae bacterium]|nr:hypothetical protein [Kiritimatiellaceae bacterium]
MKRNLILLTVLLAALSSFSAEYFVDATRPDDTGAATSWATAKKTIQAAVNLTVNGDTVWVTNGTYVLSAEISVTNAITIRSVNGPEATIVDGNGVFGCFSLNDSACTVSGFTIENGQQGVRCADTTPVVVNCVIATNRADFASGGGMFRGTAQNCIFRGNEASDGGGMAEGKSYNCTFIGNVANPFGGAIGANGYGGGQYGGETYNCLFIDNTAGMLGCTIAFGTAYNCTFISTSCVDVYRSVVYNSVFSPEKSANAGSEFYSSCASDLINGVNGNITSTPLFVDEANGDFRLQSNSPCINWGNNSVVSNATDLAGNPRIVEGTVDMGAYEYQEIVGLADSDVDGINDDWERQQGGNQNPGATCSNGVNSILQAYIAGLDPKNPQSRFQMVADKSPASDNILRWNATSGRVYSVYFSTNLLNGFQPLETNIPWTAGAFTDTVHKVDGQGFYKIGVELK